MKELYEFIENADNLMIDEKYISDGACIIHKNYNMPKWIQDLVIQNQDTCELAKIPFEKGTKAKFKGCYIDLYSRMVAEIDHDDKKLYYDKKYIDLICTINDTSSLAIDFYVSREASQDHKDLPLIKLFYGNTFLGVIVPVLIRG